MNRRYINNIVRKQIPKLATFNSPNFIIPNLSGDLSHGEVRDKDFEIWNGQKVVYYNAGNSKSGNIYMSGDNLYLYTSATSAHIKLDAKDAVDLMVNGTTIQSNYSSSVYFQRHIYMRAGNRIYFNNSDNSELGNIYRDNDYLYIDGGTGGTGLRFQVAGSTKWTLASSLYGITDLEIRSGKNLIIKNADNTEYGTITRTDSYLKISAGTGGDNKYCSDAHYFRNLADDTTLASINSSGDILANGVFRCNGNNGVSGSFTTADGKTVTVVGGIITAIV